MPFTAPELIGSQHNTDLFDCGHVALDDWLKRRALSNSEALATRTTVICDGARVIGYYALAAGSLEREIAAKSITRNMPSPIPVTVLARLAIDTAYKGQGLGADLLMHAIRRAIFSANAIGARALLAHAIDANAFAFYVKHGFLQSPVEPLTVMLDLTKVASL